MDATPDPAALRTFFSDAGCPGAVSMIDFLLSPRGEGLFEIGTGTLDLTGAMAKAETESERTAALLFKLQGFHLGSHDGSVTPMESMARMAKSFENLPRGTQLLFDRICRDMIIIINASSSVADRFIADDTEHVVLKK